MMQPTNINYEPAGGYSFEDDSADPGLGKTPLNQQQAPIDHNAPASNSPPAQPAYSHPVATIFHLLFKGMALLCFLFFFLFFSSSFVIPFIVTVIFIAFDFWTVKNITGRILVGLRWWNEVTEDGTNKWIFESVENKSNINAKESLIFWVSLVVTPALWIILAITSIAHPLWLVVPIIGIVLGCANVMGYWKCSRDAKKKFQSAATGFAITQLLNRATSAV